MLTIICFVGACITFPILFPINATGGGGQKELDIISFSNINESSSGKNRYYAHAILGWVFFSEYKPRYRVAIMLKFLGFVMFVITKETIYFINIRNMYLLAPFNAARISSRTVLFTQVPAEYLNAEKLHQLFGPSLNRSWIAQDCTELEDEVEERDKTVMKLEGAEIKLSQTANKKRIKWEKKNQKTKEPIRDAADEESASLSSKWLEKKDRPTHRLGKIPLIGKKVDTIEWSRSELGEKIPKIEAAQEKHLKTEGKLLPSVFVEFKTQQAAEAAYRRMTPKKSPKFTPRAIGVIPEEIVWENLKLTKSGWKLRKIGTTTFIVLMILFWSIPVAVIGAISNINYLTNLVPFLSFINKIPKVILGVVTGLLPSVLLSVLMALVPIVCRSKSVLLFNEMLSNQK
jgi:calcium permeable stress-gated cation channel